MTTESNATKRKDLFLIDPRNIVVENGFNVRIDFDLDELKEQIKENGVLNPITVIAFKDENGDEKYRLVDGERRYRATMLAIQEGADIGYVKALKADPKSTTEQLYLEQMMRNEGKRFSEYECAIMFRRFKEEFGYSQLEIAEKFKKSPAYVSKCLSLLDMPPALQQKIVKGEISVMAAKEIVKSYSTEDEQIKAAKAAIKDAKSQGKATASNKEVSQHLKDTKEVGNMIGTIYRLQAYLNGEDQIQLSVLLKQLQHSATLSQAIRQYFHVINQNKKTE